MLRRSRPSNSRFSVCWASPQTSMLVWLGKFHKRLFHYANDEHGAIDGEVARTQSKLMPKDVERMGGNLRADVVQRKKQGFGDDIQSEVGEEGDEHGYEHDQAQHEGNTICPVLAQEVAEARDKPMKRMPV